MAEYLMDCPACTNIATSADGGNYCLPQISTGISPLVFHDMGGSKAGDYFDCPKYRTDKRQPAIYELAVDYEALERNSLRAMEEYRKGCADD